MCFWVFALGTRSSATGQSIQQCIHRGEKYCDCRTIWNSSTFERSKGKVLAIVKPPVFLLEKLFGLDPWNALEIVWTCMKTSLLQNWGDFGFSRSLTDKRPMTGMCTTLWYRAPELLFGAKFYGQSVDLWSFGCVLAETMLRKPLFPGRGEFDMLQKAVVKGIY